MLHYIKCVMLYAVMKKVEEYALTIETNSPEETFEAGKKLAERISPGQIITLDGDLGVGKTVFTKGFAEGLGIKEPVTSPTFTIVQEYTDGKMPLYHFDAYRVSDPDEMFEIGFEDYLYGSGVCIIEWAALIEELLPKDMIRISINKDNGKGFDYRKIEIQGIDGETAV